MSPAIASTIKVFVESLQASDNGFANHIGQTRLLIYFCNIYSPIYQWSKSKHGGFESVTNVSMVVAKNSIS